MDQTSGVHMAQRAAKLERDGADEEPRQLDAAPGRERKAVNPFADDVGTEDGVVTLVEDTADARV